jgi:hypothetical protein
LILPGWWSSPSEKNNCCSGILDELNTVQECYLFLSVPGLPCFRERVLAHGMCTMLTVFHYSMSAWAAEYIAGKGKKGASKSNA